MANNLQIGAGIHIPPNAGRLLHQWGVAEHLEKLAIKPEGINIRRWEDGSVIGYTALDASYRSDFGAPYYVVHRAHYHDALHKVAVKLGVAIQLGARVVEYQEQKGSVVLEDGSIVAGDLVVAVDGVSRATFTRLWLANLLFQASTQPRAAISNQMLLMSLFTEA